MTALRWSLIVVTALLGAGWILLVVWAESFRRSFGASPNAAVTVVLPVVVLGLILASLLVPDLRWLQHLVAVVAAAVAVGSVVLMAETALMGSLGLAYIGLWLLHYWHTVWRAAPPG
jgi:hypothetical protein